MFEFYILPAVYLNTLSKNILKYLGYCIVHRNAIELTIPYFSS